MMQLQPPNAAEQTTFLHMTHQSKHFHHPWVKTPQSSAEFLKYLERYQQPNQKSYWLYRDEAIVGVFNVNEIVRGYFQSAYLGFYVAEPFSGQGLMSQGLKLLLAKVFTELELHRIEANIQPANVASIRLVQKNGFIKEGFSPRYLMVDGQWCDHERWALTREDWTP